jgi:hypothetical protein
LSFLENRQNERASRGLQAASSEASQELPGRLLLVLKEIKEAKQHKKLKEVS